MTRQNVFVKVSGDLYQSPDFLACLSKLTQKFFVVVCVGGGTQINKVLEQYGIKDVPHGPLGRELQTFEHRQVARDVLEQNQAILQDLLAERGIQATVIIPVLNIGSVLCHVNGDTFIETVYLGYDQLYIATTPERRQAKEKEFAHLPKVQVLAFQP